MLPAAVVLPVDSAGRLLLVRPTGEDDRWDLLGGAVDPGESPAEAAVRESREEIGVEVRLLDLIGVFGGSDYVVTYPNGDRVEYVSAAYTAEIMSGEPIPDGDEISEAAWFAVADLPGLALGRSARALLGEAGYLTA